MKMKIKLYADTCFSSFSTKEQICLNRGINSKDIPLYLSNSYNEIYPAEAFGEDLLKQATKLLMGTISANKKICIIVDCDVDGMTSAAIFINWLYENFPSYTKNYVSWLLHKGKNHGLEEFIDELEFSDYELIICPDSSSNDFKYHERLHNQGKNILILDHHNAIIPYQYQNAIIINNCAEYEEK